MDFYVYMLHDYVHEFVTKVLFFSSLRFCVCMFCVLVFVFLVCLYPYAKSHFSFDINFRYSITRLCCHITFIGYMLSRVLRHGWGMWYLEERDMCGNLNVNSTWRWIYVFFWNLIVFLWYRFQVAILQFSW